MSKKKTLPEGFRIISHELVRGAADDPYDWGEWTYKLQQWRTWDRGVLWWKHKVSGWVTVEYNYSDEALIQTALWLSKDKK